MSGKPIDEAVDLLALDGAAKYLSGRYGESDGWVQSIRAAISALTAAQQQQGQAVADETVLVERHYAENIHYAALVLAQSKSPIDRREAAVLQGIATRMGKANTSPPPSVPVVDEATARRLDDYLGGEFDIRIGKQAAHAALCHALAQQPAAVDEANTVDWRAMYRFQTAMRYMDNNPNLTKQRADKMADDDVAGLEAALATQHQEPTT